MKKWELTKEEKARLSIEDMKKYEKAVIYMNHDWAKGPYGGWSRGMDILKELGWTEKVRTESHRKFISLEKPK